MSSCTICPRTAPEGQHACPYHADEMRAWIAELPRQARLLAEFLVPTQRPTASRSGSTAHAPVPVDLRVLNLLVGPGRYDPTGPDDDGQAPIAAVLGAWAGHIAYHYPALDWHPDRDPTQTLYVDPCDQAVPTHGETITGWCAWHIAYLPYALTLPLISDFHRALSDLQATIRNLTHVVPHRHDKTAPCPRCEAFRLVAVDGQEGISCSGCGHRLTVAEYDQHTADFLHARQADATT